MYSLVLLINFHMNIKQNKKSKGSFAGLLLPALSLEGAVVKPKGQTEGLIVNLNDLYCINSVS